MDSDGNVSAPVTLELVVKDRIMGVLTSISRGLEAVSTPLGVLSDMVYAVAAASFLLLLIVYVL